MYCPRCGTKNEEDALFCKKCGNDLNAPSSGPVPPVPPPQPPGRPGKRDDDCERDCQGSEGEQRWFWGVIVIIIGLWVVVEFGLKNIVDLPREVENFEWCWAIWIVIGIAILMAGVRVLTRSRSGR